MTGSSLYQVLYVSTLCAGQPLTVVADIAHRARASNARLGITALLVFDGVHFCQLLEGDRRRVLSLADRIYEDARHESVEVLHHGAIEKRRFTGFDLSFTTGEDDMSLASLVELDGNEAVSAFAVLRDRLPG